MASKFPPVKNSAYVFRCVLFAQDTNQIKANPTLARRGCCTRRRRRWTR